MFGSISKAPATPSPPDLSWRGRLSFAPDAKPSLPELARRVEILMMGLPTYGGRVLRIHQAFEEAKKELFAR